VSQSERHTRIDIIKMQYTARSGLSPCYFTPPANVCSPLGGGADVTTFTPNCVWLWSLQYL